MPVLPKASKQNCAAAATDEQNQILDNKLGGLGIDDANDRAVQLGVLRGLSDMRSNRGTGDTVVRENVVLNIKSRQVTTATGAPSLPHSRFEAVAEKVRSRHAKKQDPVFGKSLGSMDAVELVDHLDDTLDHYRARLLPPDYDVLKQRAAALRSQGEPNAIKTEMPKIHAALMAGVERMRVPTATPSTQMPRVPTEVATHWITAVQQVLRDPSLSPAVRQHATDLLGVAQHHWMAHNLKTDDVRQLLRNAEATASAYPDDAMQKLATLAHHLRCELARFNGAEPPSTRLFDNMYGRTFESALIDNLVKAPPQGVKTSMNQLGMALAGTVEQSSLLPGFAQGLRNVQAQLHGNQRFWNAEFKRNNPAYDAFMRLHLPSPRLDATGRLLPLTQAEHAQNQYGKQLLQAMLCKPVQDGVDCIARPYLTAKLMLGFGWANILFPGSAEADRNYSEIQRASNRRDPGDPNSAERARRQKVIPATFVAGITLAYQPGAAWSPPYAFPTARPADRYEPKYANSERSNELSGESRGGRPSAETALALQNGIPYVGGASGTTNLVLHYMQAINRHQALIDIDHAMLGTCMFLNHDGGHSIHEALWTMNQVRNGRGTGQSRVSQYKSHYGEYIASFAHDAETHGRLRQAAGHAFDAMIRVRRTNVAADAFAQIS